MSTPFTVTLQLVAEMLDDDPSLGALKNQFTVQQVFDLIEERDSIANDDALFNALMGVMYATRPKGVL